LKLLCALARVPVSKNGNSATQHRHRAHHRSSPQSEFANMSHETRTNRSKDRVSAKNIHDAFKEGWKFLRSDGSGDINNNKPNVDEYDASFYDVEDLKFVAPEEAMAKSVQHAAKKWEKLDLMFGINRRKNKDKRDFKTTKLPDDFDIYQPMDIKLHKAAVKSQMRIDNGDVGNGSENDEDESDEDEMVSHLDHNQYKSKLTDIIRSVPCHSDAHLLAAGSNSSSSSSNSSASFNSMDLELSVDEAKRVIDDYPYFGIANKKHRMNCLVSNDVFSQHLQFNHNHGAEAAVVSSATSSKQIELFDDRLLFEIDVYCKKSILVKKQKKTTGRNRRPDEEEEEVNDEDEDEDAEVDNSNELESVSRHAQSITVYGNTLLSQFSETISCPFRHIYKPAEGDGDEPPQQLHDECPFKSGNSKDSILVIGKCLYVGDSYMKDDGLLKPLLSLLEDRQGIGSASSYEVKPLQGACFSDLTDLKLNDLCLYYHDRDCIHHFSFSDVSLQFVPFNYFITSSKSNKSKSTSASVIGGDGGGGGGFVGYDNKPLSTQIFLQRKKLCIGCNLSGAAYVTYHDPLLRPRQVSITTTNNHHNSRNNSVAPMFLCETCHFSLHYTPQGELLPQFRGNENFRIFPYVPGGV
jgi:hypothetical protein